MISQATEVRVKVNDQEQLVTLQELFESLDREAGSLYKCYKDSHLTKGQRLAIRSQHKVKNKYGLTRELRESLCEVFTNNVEVCGLDRQYMRWLVAYLKSTDSTMPEGAYYKRANYNELQGIEKSNARFYQLINSLISKSCSLSVRGCNSVESDKYLFRYNDLNFDKIEEYFSYFSLKKDFYTWFEKDNPGRVVIEKDKDGWYPISKCKFIV